MPGSERNRYATGMMIMLCIVLILFPEKIQAGFMKQHETLMNDMLTYALGGLDTLKNAPEFSWHTSAQSPLQWCKNI